MSKIIKYNGIHIKTELNNPGFSHKYRVAKYIIEHSIANGDIVPGKTTVIEKTGGNFGFGLLIACYEYGINVELAVGLSFSPRKRKLLEFFGARLIGKKMLEDGMSPKEVVEYYLNQTGNRDKEYFYPDQFKNVLCVEAHKQWTGAELALQLRHLKIKGEIIFICGAGTGATLTGVSIALKDAGLKLHTILVEPDGCDMNKNTFCSHRIEGISVGVPAPFLDWSIIDERQTVELAEVLEAQHWLYTKTGLFVGNSSAANIAIARRIKLNSKFNNVPIVTIAHDSGLWYDDFLHRNKGIKAI